MIVIPSAKPRLTYNPRAEIAQFGTKRSSGTFGALGTFSVNSYTDWFKVNWWDGTSTLHSSLPPNGMTSVSKVISAPYNTTDEKRFSVIPTDSSGVQIGQLKRIQLSNQIYSPISYIDVTGLSRLESFTCDSGSFLTSYTHNGRIDSFSLSSSGLTSFSIPSNSRASLFKLVANTSLTTLNGLDNLKNTLQQFELSYTMGFTGAIDLSNFLQLTNIDLQSTGITSLRAQNCALNSIYYSSLYYFSGGAKIHTSALNAAAYVQFFNDLANGSGYLRVNGTGLTAADYLIATNKGYTVLNV